MDAVLAPNSLFTALERLQEHPESLDDQRKRYTAVPRYSSGESTQPPSLPRSPQSLAAWEIENGLKCSKPPGLFCLLEREELNKLKTQYQHWRKRKHTLPGTATVGNARKNIRDYWTEQGIWKNVWDHSMVGECWKHEEMPSFGRRVYLAKVRAVHERETMASRPSQQFAYQVMKELEWLKGEANAEEIDCDQEAYDNLRLDWVAWTIWNPRWSEFPGLKWMHEEPDDVDFERVHADAKVAQEARRTRRDAYEARASEHLRRIEPWWFRTNRPGLHYEDRVRSPQENILPFTFGIIQGTQPATDEQRPEIDTTRPFLFGANQDSQPTAGERRIGTETETDTVGLSLFGGNQDSQPTAGERRIETQTDTKAEADRPRITDN